MNPIHPSTDTAPASCCDHSTNAHSHDHPAAPGYRLYVPAFLSLVMLILGLAWDFWIHPGFFEGAFRVGWYVLAYLPVGVPVLKEAGEALGEGSFFNEFTLMVVATLGAFAIGEYPEGVAVMLFYSVGELFQGAAVRRAKSNISALLDVRPKEVSRLRNGTYEKVAPEMVKIGDQVQVLAGQQVPLDGLLVTRESFFNTAALTGESRPQRIAENEKVLAGMLNEGNAVEMKVAALYQDSALARILEMVQHATARKSKTELLIRKFARIYTPIVFFLAVALVVVPYWVAADYDFRDWLYRALVFLVISCPCALVISIPLGYFGGIGAASRHGILFKGANFLDLITRVNTVVMDKTGTLTKGVFEVQSVRLAQAREGKFDETTLLALVAAVEQNSTHPIARALVNAATTDLSSWRVTGVEELAGRGLQAVVSHAEWLPGGAAVVAGNSRLLDELGIPYEQSINEQVESLVLVAVDAQYAGYVVVADATKADAMQAVTALKAQGIQTVMLSGDKQSIVQKTARELGLHQAVGELLPEGKVAELSRLKANPRNVVAFVGDGINDAPVLAYSDLGIAMGGIGSDVAIETADVVIQTDQPGKINTAIRIGKTTRSVVLQNIGLAFGVKAIVLLLGAGGVATMWEAVFADVGVALLAILNAVRILRMDFDGQAAGIGFRKRDTPV